MDDLDIKTFEQFILEAAARTYAAGIPPEAIHGLPGAKLLCYDQPPLWYRDVYWTSPTGVSFGLTTVGHVRLLKPVWWMRYDGWYDRGDLRVADFLRAALRAGCSNPMFSGCRGPGTFTSPDFGGLVYYNVVAGHFGNFSGRDNIVRDGERHPGKRERYWHNYRGGLLIEVTEVREEALEPVGA